MGISDGLLTRLWRTSLLLLGAAIALYMAAHLIQAVWVTLVIVVSVGLVIAGLVVLLSSRHTRGW